MNVKGLKLTTGLIDLISKKGENIQFFKGIELFNIFSWSGFDKKEFINLINAFEYLKSCNVFKNINDDHIFVFNYSTDVTEMDIVTVLSDNIGHIFVDIEVKNGDQTVVEKTLDSQMNKRIKNHLPQLIKNNRYIIIGVANNSFLKAYFYDGKERRLIKNINELCLLFNGLNQFNNVEEYLMQFSDMASIAKICSDIKKGEYHFFEETNKIYEGLISKINVNNAYVVYGNAGTGKSVLALRLFFENKNTKLLVMNSKLYNALGLGGYLYANDRTTYNSNIFLNNIDANTIAIIDECQRLPIDFIEKVVEKAKITYLFGDNKQAFIQGDMLLTGEQLSNHLKGKGFIVSKKTLKKSRRYSDEVNESLSFLTSKSMKFGNILMPNDYSINIYYDEHKFMEKYKKSEGIKKIYIPTYDVTDKRILIDNVSFTRASRTEDSFSLWSGIDDYFGTTYHALSFDIDNCFVYLPKTIIISYKSKNYLFSSVKDKTSESIDLYLNELNILFTRGRKSLNIYVPDIEAYLYLNEKILKIKKR